MKKDERLNASVKVANSLGYVLFWYGIFAVLLYRWFILDLTLIETIDIFLVWIVASLVQFMALASKGIPITYPIDTTRKEQKYFTFLLPIVAGALSVIILWVFREVTEVRRLLGGFFLTGFATLTLLIIYRIIVHYWEQKNT
ncbi:MAG: hypothetical protein EA374_06630 [Acholeplasmatales bacterium]|nr:MAG: hypothetical protein EA374_06630 [Acholeplasmatales bacterium]